MGGGGTVQVAAGVEEAEQKGPLESLPVLPGGGEAGLRWVWSNEHSFPGGRVGGKGTAERGACAEVMVWPPRG